jgi:hypothetical protein
VLGGEVAVPCHPQSALAGLNARPRVAAFGVSTSRAALKARSRAMRAREPGQIRKEAALSGSGHVPRICLARASHDGNARGPLSKAGRTVLFAQCLSATLGASFARSLRGRCGERVPPVEARRRKDDGEMPPVLGFVRDSGVGGLSGGSGHLRV